LALLKAYAIPNISRVLARTIDPMNPLSPEAGFLQIQDAHNQQHSGRETDSEKEGLDLKVGSGGRISVKSQIKLTPDEQVYVIAVLVVEPCKLVERYGYRKLTQKEKEVGFRYLIGLCP
jgi:hypothetical protein